MKTLTAMMVGLSMACLGGCQSRSNAEADVLSAKLQAEQAKNARLAEHAAHDESASAAAQKRIAELSAQIEADKKQLADKHQTVENLQRQLAEAERAKSAAEEQSRKAMADSVLLRSRLSHRGTLQTIDEPAPLDATIPDEIRSAFRASLAWRANQVRSLEIEIRDTPSKADAKALRARLETLTSAPPVPPRMNSSALTLGQIGPLQIDGHLRVDEVVNDNTFVATPIKIAAPITPQSTSAGSSETSATVVREEDNPIAIHGFPTKGVVTGAKITNLPGVYYVEKTQRYGSRTIFVLAPVDPSKLREYFNRLQAELRVSAKSKPRGSSEAAAK